MEGTVDGLQTFKDLDLKDLRNLDVDERNELVDEIDAGSSLDEALALLEVHMGLQRQKICQRSLKPLLSEIFTSCEISFHTLSKKRADARERYVKFALDTLVNPYEIWDNHV